MKKILYMAIAAMTAMLASCSKDEIMLYENEPGVYFNSYSTTYNFIENAINIDYGAPPEQKEGRGKDIGFSGAFNIKTPYMATCM